MACLITLRRLLRRFGGSLNICLLPGSLWKCIGGLLLFFSHFSDAIYKLTVHFLRWDSSDLGRTFAALMNIIGIRPWHSWARLICSGFPWSFPTKICAFQRGLSKAAEWGDGLWSEALSYSERSWIHSLPTCPSLNPQSSWAPSVFSRTESPGRPCLLETVSCALSPCFPGLLLGLHSGYVSFPYKGDMPHFSRIFWFIYYCCVTLCENVSFYGGMLWKIKEHSTQNKLSSLQRRFTGVIKSPVLVTWEILSFWSKPYSLWYWQKDRWICR